MTKKIEEGTRLQIARFLPDAIARALSSYHEFSQREVPKDAKEFSAHHSACKVAIAHIELLIKLARWADLPDAEAVNHNEQILLAAMLQEAENDLRGYRESQDFADSEA